MDPNTNVVCAQLVTPNTFLHTVFSVIGTNHLHSASMSSAVEEVFQWFPDAYREIGNHLSICEGRQ